MRNSKEHNPRIVVEYLPNYKVKYCFHREPILKYAGKGWNEIVGYEIVCSPSKLYPNQDTTNTPLEDFDEERREAFKLAKCMYETSETHLNRLISYKGC